MKRLLSILVFIAPIFLWSQKEFHVFPEDHKHTAGTSMGNGSISEPWDLQTAFNQSSDVVNGGDIIWLHEGIYNGRFVSHLKSTNSKKITVSAIKNEKVIINGNIPSSKQDILLIKGGNVIYKDFEITCLGEFSRNEKDIKFKRINGLSHTEGEDCEFINLRIYNNPGLGVGSWRLTGGSVFDGCLVYNNGYVAKNGKGTAEGFYVQNMSNKTRIIKNCIIFNNYYKGIEVWSANRRADYSYVKNILLENNIIFNNGQPAGFAYDNIIIASDDRNGVNVVDNVSVMNNVLYHNTNILAKEVNGNAPSLTLGFHVNSPVTNITIENNIIIGRNNALRLLHTKSVHFENNTVYSGYIHLMHSNIKHHKQWKFIRNKYFTKKKSAFRAESIKSYDLNTWSQELAIDQSSKWNHLKDFNLDNTLNITENKHLKNTFTVVLFHKEGKNVEVDFSEYDNLKNSYYEIKNIETGAVISEGTMTLSNRIEFPMGTYNKTNKNFGVYSIQFKSEEEQRASLFKRLFKWLF